MKDYRKFYVLGLIMGCAIGIFLPVSSLFLQDRHCSELVIGIVSSLYFLAMMASTNLYPRLIRKWKAYEIVCTLLMIGCIACYVYMLATTIVLYLTCILFIGFGVGANFITIQGCLNQCSAKNKSVVTGTYSLFYTIGFGAGSILGNYLYSCIREKAFLVTLGLMALDVVLIALFRVTIQYEEKNRKRLEFRTIGIMVTGGALYGYIENTCTTFLPIYSRDNMPEKWRGFLLAGFVIGGLIAIIPLSDIAEKIGVYRANLVYCLLGAVGLAGVAITDYKILFAVVAGAFVCVLYPVTLAGLNHLNLNKEQVLCATGIYTLFYSAGSTLGPCSAGVSIKLLGNNGLFYICTGCLAFYFMCNAFKLFISTENGVL